jgi:hypothetical protein
VAQDVPSNVRLSAMPLKLLPPSGLLSCASV